MGAVRLQAPRARRRFLSNRNVRKFRFASGMWSSFRSGQQAKMGRLCCREKTLSAFASTAPPNCLASVQMTRSRKRDLPLRSTGSMTAASCWYSVRPALSKSPSPLRARLSPPLQHRSPCGNKSGSPQPSFSSLREAIPYGNGFSSFPVSSTYSQVFPMVLCSL